MAERITPLKAGRRADPGADEHAELREEIAHQREEILRLRDLLIGKDAELGIAKGKLAELEQHSLRHTIALMRLKALVPGLARAVGVLRGIAGRRG